MISVIVPVYNVEPYLRKCVDSILAQTYPDLEILLVDDGSADGSGAIWLIGSQGVGKPTFETAGRAWDAEEGPLCLAQPRAGTHQITLRVGRELSPSDVNFKFFLQRGWGSEFTSAGSHRIYLSSTLFALGTGSNGHDDGNIYLRSGQTLREGNAYRFTISCIAGIGRVILRAEDVTTSVLLPQPEASPLLHPWYTLDGIPVSAPVRPGIYIKDGRKVARRQKP